MLVWLLRGRSRAAWRVLPAGIMWVVLRSGRGVAPDWPRLLLARGGGPACDTTALSTSTRPTAGSAQSRCGVLVKYEEVGCCSCMEQKSEHVKKR